MKVPWSSVWTVVKAVYMAFLHGKVVTIPGVGPVTLPSKGSTPLPPGQSRFDSIPHTPGPVMLAGFAGDEPVYAGPERRASKPPRRSDGLPEVVPPPEPLSLATLGVVLFVFFGLPIIALTMLGICEWRTLSDDKPGNHVSATVRAAWRRAPGAVFLATLVWVAFLVAIGFGLLGHFFW